MSKFFKKFLASVLLVGLCGSATAAPGWTTSWAQVLLTYPSNGSFYVLFDAGANNVNGCSIFAGNFLGLTGGWFQVVYAAGGNPTESQKVLLTQLQAAQAAGKLVSVYAGACTASAYNSLDYVAVKTN